MTGPFKYIRTQGLFNRVSISAEYHFGQNRIGLVYPIDLEIGLGLTWNPFKMSSALGAIVCQSLSDIVMNYIL